MRPRTSLIRTVTSWQGSTTFSTPLAAWQGVIGGGREASCYLPLGYCFVVSLPKGRSSPGVYPERRGGRDNVPREQSSSL